MENKRKAVADDNRPRQRRRREPEAETLDGRTAIAGGNGTLQELPQGTAATAPAAGLRLPYSAGVSSQSGGALDRGGLSGTRHGGFSQATANAAGDGITGTSPAMAVTSGYGDGSSQFDGAANSAGGGSGYRAPPQGILRPPLGNLVSGTGHGGFQPPVGNPAHAATGPGYDFGLVSGSRNRTGRGQPYGNSSGPSSSSAPVNTSAAVPGCTLCNQAAMVIWYSVPLCMDCYKNPFTRTVLQIPRPAIGQQVQSQPSSAAQNTAASGSGTGSALVSRGNRAGTEQQPRPHGHSSGSGTQLQLGRGTACAHCRTLTMAGLLNESGWFMPLCENCARKTRYYSPRATARRPEVDLGILLGHPASSAQGQHASSSSSQPAAANARPCAHLHGGDKVCSLCNRGASKHLYGLPDHTGDFASSLDHLFPW